VIATLRSLLPAGLLLALSAGPRPCPAFASEAPAGLHLPRRCDCMTPPAPREAQAQATALFLGVADSIAPARLPFAGAAGTYEGYRVRFRVLAAWPTGRRPGSPRKDATAMGPARKRAAYRAARADTVIDVGTGAGGGDCGFAFRRGETYLVYASGPPEALLTGICQRTRAEPDIASELSALGPPGVDRRARRDAGPPSP
jgi:hypothetical protein